MTAEQKIQIIELRKQGKSIKEIADETGVNESPIKKQLAAFKELGSYCICCGTPIPKSKYKPRKYCSAKCKFEYYKLHPEVTTKKTYHRLICQCCQREFLSYAKAKRKYCSKSCASKSRFK